MIEVSHSLSVIKASHQKTTGRMHRKCDPTYAIYKRD